MSEYGKAVEPKEVLNHAMGMLEALIYVNQNEGLLDALSDIKADIEWVLCNATMDKKVEDKK